jgi:hypothetical protein
VSSTTCSGKTTGNVEVVAVAGHRREVETERAELLRELPRAIGAEVEEDGGVALRVEARSAVDDDGLDELVGDASVIARLHGRDRIVRVLALAVHDGAQRPLGAVPAVVAVHRVVAAGHGRNPVDGQLGEVVNRRGRGHVAAVGERVDPRLLRREGQQRLEVVDVRVHTSVRHQAEQVDALPALEGGAQGLVLEQRAVADRAVDPLQVLVEDAARADRQVPDLGVAHLSVRQADCLARGDELRVRIVAPQPVEDGRVRELDGVARPRRRDAPAVEDDERYEGVWAVWHIAVKDSTSREAPPTSAPSTAGSASSSAAFSGFTEPP